MKVIMYLDGEHNTVEVKDKIKSVLPDANYMIFGVKDENAFAIIKQQQAEIERLQKVKEQIKKEKNKLLDAQIFLAKTCDGLEEKLKTTRAKAIKEFWGKLKKHSRKMQSSDFSGEFWDRAILVTDGDNLVKEMVGE